MAQNRIKWGITKTGVMRDYLLAYDMRTICMNALKNVFGLKFSGR